MNGFNRERGIRERRIAKSPSHSTGYMAIKAAENLCAKNNIDPKTIDLVLVATITPDYQVSSTAPYVASQIGATNAFGYDISAACSGFLYGMTAAAAYITSGQYQRVLLIGADKMSSIVDYTDRATCIIFGDGAGAVLFEPSNNTFGFESAQHGSNGIGRDYLNIHDGGSLHPTNETTFAEKRHLVQQEGRTVFKYAVKHMSEASQKVLTKHALSHEDINYVIAHQANKRILDATAHQLGIAKEKVLTNIEHYGNTTAATLPSYCLTLRRNSKQAINSCSPHLAGLYLGRCLFNFGITTTKTKIIVFMDLKEIQNLIKFVAKSGASEVNLEMDDVKITIKTGDGKVAGETTTIVQQMPPVVAQPMAAAPVAAAPAAPVAEAPAAEAPKVEEADNYITVKSPIIGTFYRKPSPDKPVFAEVGQQIGEGDVLCVIEAMKLFNEIESK